MKEIQSKKIVSATVVGSLVFATLIVGNQARKENKTVLEYLTAPINSNAVSSISINAKINDMSEENLINCCIVVDRLFQQYFVKNGLDKNSHIFFYDNQPYAVALKFTEMSDESQQNTHIEYQTTSFNKLNKTFNNEDLKMVLTNLIKIENHITNPDFYSPETIKIALKTLYSFLELPSEPFENPDLFALSSDQYLFSLIDNSFESLDEFFNNSKKLDNVGGSFSPNTSQTYIEQSITHISNNHIQISFLEK